jgi:hypothetical protein
LTAENWSSGTEKLTLSRLASTALQSQLRPHSMAPTNLEAAAPAATQTLVMHQLDGIVVVTALPGGRNNRGGKNN